MKFPADVDPNPCADPGGGPRGPCPPPSPQNIAPPNSEARAKRALVPPPPPPLQNPGSAYATPPPPPPFRIPAQNPPPPPPRRIPRSAPVGGISIGARQIVGIRYSYPLFLQCLQVFFNRTRLLPRLSWIICLFIRSSSLVNTDIYTSSVTST